MTLPLQEVGSRLPQTGHTRAWASGLPSNAFCGHTHRKPPVKDTYSAAAVLCSPGPGSPPLTALADLKVKECRLK